MKESRSEKHRESPSMPDSMVGSLMACLAGAIESAGPSQPHGDAYVLAKSDWHILHLLLYLIGFERPVQANRLVGLLLAMLTSRLLPSKLRTGLCPACLQRDFSRALSQHLELHVDSGGVRDGGGWRSMRCIICNVLSTRVHFL